MRLNLAIATFALVSLALTSGCAANFGEDQNTDSSLNPKSGELNDIGEAAKTPIGDKQTQLVDTHPQQAVGGALDRVVSRDHYVQGSLGPTAGVPDIKGSMDQDQQLKRDFSAAFAAQADEVPAGDARTSVDGH